VPVSSAAEVVRFGLFELDLKAGRLSRNGASIRLPQQPLQLLAALVERPGEVVSREELTRRLWSSDVFVDFDHGLNKSVQKLRDALGDSAESPRYIETIPRVGYRFIAPVSHGTSRVEEGAEIVTAPKAPEVSGVSQASSTVLESTRRWNSGRAWLVAVGCLAVAAVIAGSYIYRRMHVAGPIRSVAVLPLDNLSGDPAQDYFADGMTDELTTMLAKDSTLRVVSRTSAMQYKRAHRPLAEIAQALGVDGVLEGSVERKGERVHMTLQLIQTPIETHVWAESYDRDANAAVSLPDEVARTIAKRLKSAVAQPPVQRYVSPEAHDAYLRGRYLWYLGSNDEAGKYFRKAVELQPDYALGWFGVSSYYGQGAFMDIDPEEALPREEAAARKAIELDDSLAEGHLAMGAARFFQWDFAQAERELGRAIALNPDQAETWHLRAKMYGVLNRNDEAIRDEKKAMELDPFDRPFAMAMVYYTARRYDEAIADARTRLESTPSDPGLRWALCEAYRRKGDLKNAAAEWEKMIELEGNPVEAAAIRRIYEKDGYDGLLFRRLDQLKSRSAEAYVAPTEYALQYAQLGRREETIQKLEEAYRRRDPGVIWLQTEPAYDFLHGDERYRAIVRGIGMPPTW
jgi:TolB-like protein/DNA-binding winged helix-turn-helix (wHTH) protein/Tfp pilus assembly protein PilF